MAGRKMVIKPRLVFIFLPDIFLLSGFALRVSSCSMKAVNSILASVLLISAAVWAGAQSRSGDVDRAFAEATRLHESGEIEAAIKAYQAILASRPERADVRSNLGAAFARLGRYQEAVEQYQRALFVDRRNHTIRFNLALAHYKAAQYDEAATELASLAAEQPENLNAILLLADCRLRLGENKKVIELLSPLESKHGDHRVFAYLLGSALVSDKQLEKGQALIDRVFRAEDSAEAHALLGAAHLMTEDSQSALKEFERAIQLNPKLPTLRAWYGRTWLRLGEIENARKAFEGELEINPADFESNLYLGVLLRKDGKLDEALAHLRRASQARPKDAGVRYLIGSVFMATGKIAEAQQLLEAVVKEVPDFVEAHVLLARAYYRLNRKEDGDRHQAIIQKLNAERQAKQPGAQEAGTYRGDKLIDIEVKKQEKP
jgi:tetratricopeptide (TPR) repeat protein